MYVPNDAVEVALEDTSPCNKISPVVNEAEIVATDPDPIKS